MFLNKDKYIKYVNLLIALPHKVSVELEFGISELQGRTGKGKKINWQVF